MSGGSDANSAKIAEIRGRAEDALKYGEPSGFGQLARDVLALVEVVEAAQTAAAALRPEIAEGFYVTWREEATAVEIAKRGLARLEQALQKFDLEEGK